MIYMDRTQPLNTVQKCSAKLTRKNELNDLEPGYTIAYETFPNSVDMKDYLKMLKDQIGVVKECLDDDVAKIDLCPDDASLIRQYRQVNKDIIDLVVMLDSYSRLLASKVTGTLSASSSTIGIGFAGITQEVDSDIRKYGHYCPSETIIITELKEYEEEKEK